MLARLGKRFEEYWCPSSDGQVFCRRAYRPLGPLARMLVLLTTVSGMREMPWHSAVSVDPLQPEIHNCKLCADLLWARARFSCDPDTEVLSWLTEGAPARILYHPLQMGIFPDAVQAADIMDPVDGVFGDPAMRMSYASAEEDDYAVGELDQLCVAGFIKKFATLDLCAEFLGCTPVVSKIRARHQGETFW